MNKNQVKGVAKDIAGKVQEEAGKLVGNKEQQVKGLGKQISGKAEKIYGDYSGPQFSDSKLRW